MDLYLMGLFQANICPAIAVAKDAYLRIFLPPAVSICSSVISSAGGKEVQVMVECSKMLGETKDLVFHLADTTSAMEGFLYAIICLFRTVECGIICRNGANQGI